MCGIAGILAKDEPVTPGRIEAMLSRLRHRGPDGLGFHRSPFVHAGMSRLAILDVEAEGLCPVVHTEEDGPAIVLVYNGEIYNYLELRRELRSRGYEFHTSCDSEVLMHAYREWGEACLDRLNGMFAFAVLDYRNDLLFAARDRVGEKPLYYFEDDERFIFASEIKAILTQIATPDLNVGDEFRALEYMAREETLFRDVYSLLPGHKLVYHGLRGRPRGRTVTEYWRLSDNLRDVDPQRAVDELDELLHDSVRLRLRSDVPWGLYLSGGLDSSLIAYIAKPSVCFSCQFPLGAKYDELAYAEVAARELGAEHVVIRPTREEFEESLPAIMYHLELPVGSFSVFPLFMLAREARRHVKVVLSGEGSDELFAGYARYLIVAHEQQLYRLPAMSHYGPLLDYYYGRPLDRFARLLSRSEGGDGTVRAIIAPYFEQFSDPVHAMGYSDLKLTLVALLQMEDRTAAAFGLENRSPFLDHRVVEFAFSIPGDMKIRGLTQKWILRQVAARYLPAALLERKDKIGLIAPINIWMGFDGRRGEFDRTAYHERCMDAWRKVFLGQPPSGL